MHLQQQASMKKRLLRFPSAKIFRICNSYVQDTASGLCDYH